MKLEYPYIIFNEDGNLVDSFGNEAEDGLPDLFVDEKSALTEIEYFYSEHDQTGPYFVGKIQLLKKVSPPEGIRVEKI